MENLLRIQDYDLSGPISLKLDSHGSARVDFSQSNFVLRGMVRDLTRMVVRAVAFALFANTLGGCASLAPKSPTTEADYRNRAVTRTEGKLRVSTAVLSPDESAAIYGVPLAKRGIQPVWVEIENHEEQPYYLLYPGLDPNFFPASKRPRDYHLRTNTSNRQRSQGVFGNFRFATQSHQPQRSRGSC
jgi:hypothetical protein